MYRYYVSIDADSREYADRVMSERMMHDEDYGFRYQIISFWGEDE